MTGGANDQGFASFLAHDLCPRGSIFSPVFEIGQCSSLVDHAWFIVEGAAFTGRCQKSSSHLLPLRADDGGITINQERFVIPSQREPAKAGDQRLLSTLSMVNSNYRRRAITPTA